MVNYLIVDDEYIAHNIIKGYCDLVPGMQLKKNCYDALEAFEYLSKNKVDLMFLDLNMPVLKGFDFLRTLKDPPKVIVTTAYREFALEGYEHHIVDYLLKPFSFERFLKAVNLVVSSSIHQSVIHHENSLNTHRFFVQSNKKHIQLDADAILYIEASGNYTKIVSVAETITIREKFSVLLALLPKNEFMQVQKSFAVSLKHINNIEGNQIWIKGHIVPIGKMYRLGIERLLR